MRTRRECSSLSSLLLVLFTLFTILLRSRTNAAPILDDKQIVVILPTTFPSPLPSQGLFPLPSPQAPQLTPAPSTPAELSPLPTPVAPVTSPGAAASPGNDDENDVPGVFVPITTPVPSFSPVVPVPVPVASTPVATGDNDGDGVPVIPVPVPVPVPGEPSQVPSVPSPVSPIVSSDATPPQSPIPEPDLVSSQSPQPSQPAQPSQTMQPSQVPQPSQPTQPSQTEQPQPDTPEVPIAVTEAAPTPGEGETLVLLRHSVDTSAASSDSLPGGQYSQEFNECFKQQAAAATGTDASNWALTGIDPLEEENTFEADYSVALPEGNSNETEGNYRSFVNDGELDQQLADNCNAAGVQVRLAELPKESPDADVGVAGAASDPEDDIEGDGISAGRIAGITVGVIAGAAILALAALGMTRLFKRKPASSNGAVGGDSSTIFSEDPESAPGTARTSTVTAGERPRSTEYDADAARHEGTGLPTDTAAKAAGAAALGAAAAGGGVGLAKAVTTTERDGEVVEKEEATAAAVAGDAAKRRHPHDWIVGQGPVTSSTPLPPEDYVFREEDAQAMPTDVTNDDYISRTRTSGGGGGTFDSDLPEYEEGVTYRDPPEYGNVIETEDSGSTVRTGRSGGSGRTPPRPPPME